MQTSPLVHCASKLGLGALAGAVALILGGGLAHAAAGGHIGSAILVENLVTAGYARDTRTLQVGDGVRQEERIEVGLDARSEFQLNDDTKFALGPGSKMTLDKFVYDPDEASGSIVLNLAKGTMRWVTGVAKKPTYVIRTPNASITVRGTIFDLYVTQGGETWLLLHEGAVQVCNDHGQCKVHEESCKLTRVSDTGEVAGATSWSKVPGARANMFHRAFPFVVMPPEINPNPGCTRDAIMNQKDASAPPPPKVRKASIEPAYKPSYAVEELAARPAKRAQPVVRQASYEPVEPVREKKAEYVKPKREAKAERKPPRVKVRYVAPRQPVRYAERDDDDNDRSPRYPRRHGSGVGKVLLGAALIGGAIALGSMRGGGHGGY